jgi:hypothetical protein
LALIGASLTAAAHAIKKFKSMFSIYRGFGAPGSGG